ncbi:unnamed protein product [Rodentolepis nana]|uniref:Shugoshin C-terminal domain-containing protein n=1 Tax=Rodentolepis nana TaxID=102285 RepID=A0A0R3TS74_RODNA|nr:unnamed protein product [Rodentolepis nana]
MDSEIRELKRQFRNLNDRFSMLQRFVSNINDKVNKRLKKFELLSTELLNSHEIYPVEVVDVTPEGLDTPTKQKISSPVVSSSKIAKRSPLTPESDNSNAQSTSNETPRSCARKRRRSRLVPSRSQLVKIMKELEGE